MTLQSQMVLYLRLINFEAAKQICQATIALLNVLRHGMQPISLHVVVSRLCYNDIFNVLKFSCSDRDRFQRKNTLISRTVGSLKVLA